MAANNVAKMWFPSRLQTPEDLQSSFLLKWALIDELPVCFACTKWLALCTTGHNHMGLMGLEATRGCKRTPFQAESRV